MSRVGSAGGWRRPAAATAGEGPRPRILFVVRTLNPGGAEGQLALLAAGLRRRGHPVAVLALYPGGALEPGLRAAGVQVDTPRKAGRWDVLGFSRRIAALARAYRPDLVHGYMDAGNLAALAVKAAWPRAALVWGERMSAIDLARYERFVRAAHRAVSLLARAPDLVIANSVAGAAFARARGVPAARVRVVPNGIDTERFRPCREAGLALRAAWKIAPGEVVVGMVGRMDPMKDHPTFLRTASRLAADFPDLRFVVVGDGDPGYREVLRVQAEELGLGARVVWAGKQNDMPAVYSAMDLLCSSSSGEGFANVIGEAMACGVACVVTDVGDSARLVGRAEAVAPPRDPGALAACAAALLRDPGALAREGCRARARVREHYSVEALVSVTEALLMQLWRTKST